MKSEILCRDQDLFELSTLIANYDYVIFDSSAIRGFWGFRSSMKDATGTKELTNFSLLRLRAKSVRQLYSFLRDCEGYFYTTHSAFNELPPGFLRSLKGGHEIDSSQTTKFFRSIRSLKRILEKRDLFLNLRPNEGLLKQHYLDEYQKIFDYFRLSPVDRDLITTGASLLFYRGSVALVTNDKKLALAQTSICNSTNIPPDRFWSFMRKGNFLFDFWNNSNNLEFYGL